MTKSPVESAVPPAAPAPWPMTFVWLGDHWSRDWAKFWTGASQVDDPVGAAQAEGGAMLSLTRDWLVAMGALWTLPISAWIAAQPPRQGNLP